MESTNRSLIGLFLCTMVSSIALLVFCGLLLAMCGALQGAAAVVAVVIVMLIGVFCAEFAMLSNLMEKRTSAAQRLR